MRLPSDKQVCARRRMRSALRAESGRCQTQRGGKGRWDAKQSDHDLPSSGNASIASQSLLPAEAITRALCAREEHVRNGWQSGGRRKAHLHALVAHELDAGPPMFSAAPIAPKERGGTHLERMQQPTDFAGLCCIAGHSVAMLAKEAR